MFSIWAEKENETNTEKHEKTKSNIRQTKNKETDQKMQ